MPIFNRERKEAVVIIAETLRTEWLQAREANRVAQLAINVEVRKAWGESDPAWARQSCLECLTRSFSYSSAQKF